MSKTKPFYETRDWYKKYNFDLDKLHEGLNDLEPEDMITLVEGAIRAEIRTNGPLGLRKFNFYDIVCDFLESNCRWYSS